METSENTNTTEEQTEAAATVNKSEYHVLLKNGQRINFSNKTLCNKFLHDTTDQDVETVFYGREVKPQQRLSL